MDTASARHIPPDPEIGSRPHDEAPLRAELFSIAQLEVHARSLAGSHVLAPSTRGAGSHLLERLASNEATLRETYDLLAKALDQGRKITPAAEWFVDNFHLIEQQIRLARLHLPRSYDRELPRLTNPRSLGSPRVYDIVQELISHSHGRIDHDRLRAFVDAYQRVRPLRLGELWAIPIMLRLALIENLRRVSASVTSGRRARERAIEWAEKLVEVALNEPANVVVVLADLVRSGVELSDPFVAELAFRLQGQGPALGFATSWLEQRLTERGETVEHLHQRVSHDQASVQVAVSNSIGSLRSLGAIDWRDFVERIGLVDHELARDPSGVYATMDFGTRDRYRHVVEHIARRSGRPESEIATLAVTLAHRGDARTGHVGWFLVGPGRAQLEHAAGIRGLRRSTWTGVASAVGVPLYVATVVGLTALLTWTAWLLLGPAMVGALAALGVVGWGGTAATIAIVGALASSTSQLAIALVHWFSTSWFRPSVLPRLDFSAGIPAEHHTLVAVPILLTGAAEIDELVEALEVRHLANRDRNLHFCLVSDFRDAKTEHTDADEALLARAVEGIEALNRKYGPSFLLLHRPRRFNARDRVWMGWERKRGKLEDLNDALRGDASAFSTIVGPLDALQDVRYVIALDADTELPRDAARTLAATLAHPLNRPQYDAARGRVTSGYAILQPRMSVTMHSAAQSRFAALFGGDPGIDPYTRAVSDVYQDLFAEGSFVGKGIYDVDAVRSALGGRLPTDRVLSHDLLEGAYGRAGLVSDVMLFEDYPRAYAADVSRRHRWMRGDWQLVPWLGLRVPAGVGSADARDATRRRPRVRNPITALSRWKIVDNLRRTLVPAAQLAILAAGWLFGPALLATLLVLAVATLPGVLAASAAATRRPAELTWRMHVTAVARDLSRQLARDAIAIVALPHDAWLGVDAIARTFVRMVFTRRKLLEWRTANDAQRGARSDLAGAYASMWISPVIAVAIAGALAWLRPEALLVAAPLLAAWLLAPTLTWWLSLPTPPRALRLDDDERTFLGALARRTWRFFETFVVAEDHWLPPDNVQEQPPRGVAHRTSPTNIGLSLTASLAAYDLGYIDASTVAVRTRRTLDTLDTLERHRGHFLNWYDTLTLQPLAPRYISTVDSGNLSGHLLVLASGLEQLGLDPLARPQIATGLVQTLDAIDSVMRAGEDPKQHTRGSVSTMSVTVPTRARVVLARMHRLLAEHGTPANMVALRALLVALESSTDELVAVLDDVDPDLRAWGHALADQRREAIAALDHAAPWIAILDAHQAALGDAYARLAGFVSALDVANASDDAAPEIPALRDAWQLGVQRARQRLHDHAELAARARALADVEYEFLYDRDRHLLAIGYNLSEHRLDASFYDLLASEARLASYVAIAEGKLPQDHWFALGRMLTTSGGRPALLSWSGSMFEYLMPLLVMPTYDGTILDETYRAVIARQIEYGRDLAVPWGVSESGYHKLSAQLDYQYQAFGVPGLGFKRGLGDELVIAPYATVMATMVAPRAACTNLRRLASEGQLGRFGFYEAVDYTASRLPPREPRATVCSFMAHHQGMSLLSLDYVLCDRPMQRRFLGDPALRATELLLQERVPRAPAIFPHPAEAAASREAANDGGHEPRFFGTAATPAPEVHLLSNGRYHVAITNAGGGYSRWGDLAVTRWREDPTRDAWGAFGYLRDVDSGEFWSFAHQPTLRVADRYEAIYSPGRAEFRRRDGDIETHTEISVSPEDDAELRRVTITNHGRTPRTIELTSYAEVVLNTHAADVAHAAFSNLFVQTELVPAHQAILCTRRPRSADETPPWMVHMMTTSGTTVGTTSYECSRVAFIGRNRTIADPLAMHVPRLGDTAGSVLDPIVAIRTTVVLAPLGTARMQMVTGVASAREGALGIIERYAEHHAAERLLELSFTHTQVEERRLGVTAAECQLYERLASSVLYSNPVLRAPRSVIARNVKGQSSLWGYGISGDLPIVLVRIGKLEHLDLVRQVVKAHAYWRAKGLVVEVVIWNEDPSGYRQELQEQIVAAVGPQGEGNLLDRPGGVFVRRGEQISELDGVLLQTIARVVLRDESGTLEAQLERRVARVELPPRLVTGDERARPLPGSTPTSWPAQRPVFDRPDLAAFNGTGGFTKDGREYVITTQHGAPSPAPWSNVLANQWFGTVVTDSGGAYTWCENAHSYRLTPWNNDPVGDASGETIHIRDESDGHVWSPTQLPAGDDNPYITRHGFGYTVYEHLTPDGIQTTLTTFVATDAPIKFLLIEIVNRSGKPRRLSITACFELVLGAARAHNLPHVVTEIDPRTGAILARNNYEAELSRRVAFLDVSEEQRTATGDRTEMLGRNGTPSRPAWTQRTRLSGRAGAGYDPCLAMQIAVDLPDGHAREIAFTFGSGRDRDDALHLVSRFRGVGPAREALAGVWAYWGRTLGAVHVTTPDPKLDFLVNGWLVYQVLAARLWARSGFYQSSGAFGYRDQLQDCMSLVHAEPELLRAQIVRCASRQFREGDVQHWWHPPHGRGARTRISDDYLWLPYATCRYIAAIGDTGVLDEQVHFLEGRAVNTGEDGYYDLPLQTEERATVYEHCVRAIEHGMRFGERGLPLMGTGDWNDGMNLVGERGRGESVWLAFFFHDVLVRFAAVARARDDHGFASRCTTTAQDLARAIERHGWDGQWYRRAYDDDGVALGSAAIDECQIDALPQSWAALTGVGDPARTRQALASLDARLVDRDVRVVKLLTPPFDTSEINPGYIKGYLPGVRENGAQYTHAAVWTAMAFAAVGDAAKAWELFDLINPVRHGDSREHVDVYKVEPYVVAADVYTNPQHAGRGGWTWYTGSAGWMYRLVTESLLGLRLEVDKLRVEPLLAPGWDGFEVHYRWRETVHHIRVVAVDGGVVRVVCDGVEQPDRRIPLADDRREHHAVVEVPR